MPIATTKAKRPAVFQYCKIKNTEKELKLNGTKIKIDTPQQLPPYYNVKCKLSYKSYRKLFKSHLYVKIYMLLI